MKTTLALMVLALSACIDTGPPTPRFNSPDAGDLDDLGVDPSPTETTVECRNYEWQYPIGSGGVGNVSERVAILDIGNTDDFTITYCGSSNFGSTSDYYSCPDQNCTGMIPPKRECFTAKTGDFTLDNKLRIICSRRDTVGSTIVTDWEYSSIKIAVH